MKTREQEMREQCEAFHKKHPEVWRLFVRFTQELIAAGHRHYSAKGIFERIRWEQDVVKPQWKEDGFVGSGCINGGQPVSYAKKQHFKLNNNYSSFYARRFMTMFPDHGGFFRTRKRKSANQAATHLPELTRDYFE
tara:strand:- start:1085 stop:1492 length:408 start_codon:yes stop_codon:yes gene_type:complete